MGGIDNGTYHSNKIQVIETDVFKYDQKKQARDEEEEIFEARTNTRSTFNYKKFQNYYNNFKVDLSGQRSDNVAKNVGISKFRDRKVLNVKKPEEKEDLNTSYNIGEFSEDDEEDQKRKAKERNRKKLLNKIKGNNNFRSYRPVPDKFMETDYLIVGRKLSRMVSQVRVKNKKIENIYQEMM